MDEQEKQQIKKKKQKKLIRQGIIVGSILVFIVLLIILFNGGNKKQEGIGTGDPKQPCPSVLWVENTAQMPIQNAGKGLVKPGKMKYVYTGNTKDKAFTWSKINKKTKKRDSKKGKSFEVNFQENNAYTIELRVKKGKCIIEQYRWDVKVEKKSKSKNSKGSKATLSFKIKDARDEFFIGDTVFFENTSQNISTFKWDFGDSTFSADQSPSHIYQKEGEYVVALSSPKTVQRASRLIKIVPKPTKKVKGPKQTASTFIDWRKYPVSTVGASFNSDCDFNYTGIKYKVLLTVKKDIFLEDFIVISESEGTEMSISIFNNDQKQTHKALYGSNYMVNNGESPCIVSSKLTKGIYVLELIINGDGHLGTLPVQNNCVTTRSLNDVIIIEYPDNTIPLFNLRLKYKE